MDKYTATWVSHTSISDFLTCPRAYYLRNVYRNPKTKHKMKIMSPPLALGQAVHEVVEALSVLPTEVRFKDSLVLKFQKAWAKVAGKKGGFLDANTENTYKKRGEDMLRKLMTNPGPLTHKAVKIKKDLPYFWLSEEANIILCGKIDWLEYLEETDSVHIIDFKTSTKDEPAESLQLPIYALLATNCQKRPVAKLSYWYLERDTEPVEQPLPDLQQAQDKVLDIAKQVKTARKLELYKCPHGERGCYACRPMEAILKGEAEYIGVDEYNYDVYILPSKPQDEDEEDSVIL